MIPIHETWKSRHDNTRRTFTHSPNISLRPYALNAKHTQYGAHDMRLRITNALQNENILQWNCDKIWIFFPTFRFMLMKIFFHLFCEQAAREMAVMHIGKSTEYIVWRENRRLLMSTFDVPCVNRYLCVVCGVHMQWKLSSRLQSEGGSDNEEPAHFKCTENQNRTFTSLKLWFFPFI